jgi:glycine/D-amino acid oxidase-like deaminating enzyme
MLRTPPYWDRGPTLVLPSLDERTSADVCVIGLGGSGLACIHALLDAGHSVVGLDAAHVAAGAAGRNGGFLLGGIALFHHDAVARFGPAVATAIYQQTLKEIERMAAETPDAVRATGTLRIAASADELLDCDAQFDAMRTSDLPVEPYDGPQGRGLFFPRDMAFDPVRRARILAERAIARGARLFGQTPALSVLPGIVRTARGVVSAPSIVVAVDGSIEQLLRQLAGRVRSARLQMLATAPAPEVSFPIPVYSRWGLDYWQQLPDGCVVLGGCRDEGGDAEWTTDTAPTESIQAALDRLKLNIGIRAPVTHRWAATVAYTKTGLPVLEEVDAGVWAVGAYSGTGNVVGALSGRAAAEMITTGRSAFAALVRA